jgi:hypothetical protein
MAFKLVGLEQNRKPPAAARRLQPRPRNAISTASSPRDVGTVPYVNCWN